MLPQPISASSCLNPFFVRSLFQRLSEVETRISGESSSLLCQVFISENRRWKENAHHAVGLNPFFVRSSFQSGTSKRRNFDLLGLNPFFVRSSFQRRFGSATRTTRTSVLIPSSSGLHFRVSPGAKVSFPPEVLIPSSSGLHFRGMIANEDFSKLDSVLIPSSSGLHFRAGWMTTIPMPKCLNPFFVRSSFQRLEEMNNETALES